VKNIAIETSQNQGRLVQIYFGIAEEERDDLIARLEALEAERLEAVHDVQLLRKAVKNTYLL
jgi:hypothetical protein